MSNEKTFQEFVAEDYKEQCEEYKQDAIEQADRVKDLFQQMLDNDYYYFGAKHVSRQLQDLGDDLENFVDRMEKESENQNQFSSPMMGY